jgi:hypothetical protein
MKLVEFMFDDGEDDLKQGAYFTPFSEYWNARLAYWLTDIPDDTPAGTLFGIDPEQATKDQWGSWYVEIAGTRYLFQAYSGMDTSKVFAPVVSDIARRFHADKVADATP